MSFARYPAYRDSGVEWLGQIPAHWEITPLKRLADFVNGDAFKPADWSESGIPIIRIQNLNGGDEFNYFDGTVEEKYLVRKGDLLFGWSGNRGTSFGPFLWSKEGTYALNQHIFRVVPFWSENTDLYWILKAVTAHVEDQAHGIIGMVHVTKGALGSIKVPVPTPEEQAAIATFLDQETAKIDALVAEQEKLIALLQEKRQAVISHAVTKGLDPDAPMKDSGVEWLGEVPRHWEVLRIKQLASFVGGGTPSRDMPEYWHGEIPWISPKDMKTEFVMDSKEHITDAGLRSSVTSLIPAGSVLMVVRSGILKHTIPVAINQKPVALNQDMKALLFDSSRLAALFVLRFIQGLNDKLLLEWSKQGATVESIEHEYLVNSLLPVPPISEQTTIVAHLDHVTAQLDDLMSEARTAITLLQERRTALISAAVTGQIDVRGLVRDASTPISIAASVCPSTATG